jgi:methyl-accepting chemotaxis protein
MIIFVVIFLIIIYLYVDLIVKPISLLTEKVAKIINKELPLDTDMTVKTNDEIELLSKSFDKFIHILKKDIDIINKLTNILKNESENLDKIVAKEKDIVNTQASSITQLASAIEEFSKTMEKITEVNKKALGESKELKETAIKNRSAQERVREGMVNLKNEMEETFILFSNIIQLNEDIKGIADIIDNITDQIKIIAFNASLEAAHAGEKGKGFSVIAEQIRELLGHIAKQNVNIKNLVDENSINITKISKSSEKLAYFLDNEEENIRTINQFIDSVFELLEKNEEFIRSISFSQNEQRIAIEEFVTSIKESKEKTQEAKKLAESISESVSVLKEMVNELNQVKNRILE